MKDAAYIHGTGTAEQERLALLNRMTNKPFLDFLRPGESERILEVGSGLGILTSLVAERAVRGMVCGVEYSGEQLSARARSSMRHLRFAQADAHALPFADESFDVVYCRYLLEHVREPLRVLSEIRRVLRRGGRALVQDNDITIIVFDPELPRFETLWRKFARLQSLIGGDATIGKKLFSLFKRTGFREIELSVQPEIHHSGKESFRPWVENLIGIVRGGAAGLRQHGLADDEEITESISELEGFVERHDASTIFYWNRAIGVK